MPSVFSKAQLQKSDESLLQDVPTPLIPKLRSKKALCIYFKLKVDDMCHSCKDYHKRMSRCGKKPRKDSKPKCEQPWQDKNTLHLYGRKQKNIWKCFK